LTVVRRVFLAGSLFLHNLPICFGQFVRLRPISRCDAEAVLLILQVLIFFPAFLLFMLAVLVYVAEGVLAFLFYLLFYGFTMVLAVSSLPRPLSSLIFCFSCDPISHRPHYYLVFFGFFF
jgi:hypothetical protein